MTDKGTLRAHYLRLRAAAKSEQRDAAILQNILHSPFAEAESFFIYCSVGSEVATGALICALLAAGRRVCVPRIEGDMLAVPYGPLEEGAFGIPAPRGGEDTFCDVVFAPLLAADGRGVRLGQGGGYYDRYFARRPQALRVGLAYRAQLVSELPRDTWDMPLHAVVTEEGITRFPNT